MGDLSSWAKREPTIFFPRGEQGVEPDFDKLETGVDLVEGIWRFVSYGMHWHIAAAYLLTFKSLRRFFLLGLKKVGLRCRIYLLWCNILQKRDYIN